MSKPLVLKIRAALVAWETYQACLSDDEDAHEACYSDAYEESAAALKQSREKLAQRIAEVICGKRR